MDRFDVATVDGGPQRRANETPRLDVVGRVLSRGVPDAADKLQLAIDFTVARFRIRIMLSKRRPTTFVAAVPHWTWSALQNLGSDEYHYFLLIGEKESRFRHLYSDPSSDYLFFLVPADQVDDLFAPPRQDALCLPAYPPALGKNQWAPFTRWSVTQAEVEEAFADADL